MYFTDSFIDKLGASIEKMRKIENLGLKIKLTNEYLRNGGLEKIQHIQILEDLLKVSFYYNGEADPNTITPTLNAFMTALLGSHLIPPMITSQCVTNYLSLTQKGTCFNQTTINEENEIDELIEKYKNTNNILFRGQREAKWGLYSSLQRNIINRGVSDKIDYLKLLNDIIKLGKEKYSEEILRILNYFNIDTLNDVAILGYLQHHNCPTPLLDWTYSFNNALYFGIDGIENNSSELEINDYFSVYFIEEQYLDNGSIKALIIEGLDKIGKQLKNRFISLVARNTSQKEEMESRFKDIKYFDIKKVTGSGLINHMTKIEHLINFPLNYFNDNDKESGIVFSLRNNKNILNQKGAFSWNNHPYKPLETIGNEQYISATNDKEINTYRFCDCYNINKKLKDYIEEKLESGLINNEFIYPDNEIDAFDILETCLNAST